MTNVTGLPDSIPGPGAPALPNPYEEWVQGAVPSLWQAQTMSAAALRTMESAEAELRTAHEGHANAEREYRKLKFRLSMEARGVEVDGKRLTDRERGQWVDAESADSKADVRTKWGLVEAARANATRADRAQATVKTYTAWAARVQE